MQIKPQQVRAARALLGWSQSELAGRAGIAELTVINFENGKSTPSSGTVDKILNAVDSGGVEFTDQDGVRMKMAGIKMLSGREGFGAFRKDVLSAVVSGHTDICVSNVDESKFAKWGEGEINDSYVRQMTAYTDRLNFRVLIEEDDPNEYASTYVMYRRVKKELFGTLSFYIYGQKTAVIDSTQPDFMAFLIDYEPFKEYYQREFNRLWDGGK